ncbi:hypothetical protein [Okeania sp. KiyG1]|uniref:hypothetical protein n=1 Tax=Okeania sp. KiyG1 TaxID=2720165 RepID=UPI001921CD92|nr:hypothetical protein [Okeania sp. KiyG1]GGA49188.1 hypothetical protein CYANOKiyG1_68340 [Okeania sp. KiyG1]
MSCQTYITNKLKYCSTYELNIQDKSRLQKKTLEEFILQKVVSGKFRKWKVNENHKQEIYQGISHNINNEQPIKFTFGLEVINYIVFFHFLK